MKKTKLLLAAGLALVLACTAGFAGCGAREYELSSYRGETKDEDGNTVYNTELFYSNQVQQGYPDPQVLDDMERSGYYYLFGTWNSFTTMRSKDLVNWEDVGPTFLQRQSEDVRRATAGFHLYRRESRAGRRCKLAHVQYVCGDVVRSCRAVHYGGFQPGRELPSL